MPRKKKEPSNSTKLSTEKEPLLEDKLLKNLVELQKVHTDLAEKFDKLTKEISNLLNLFELTAKSFAKQHSLKPTESDKEFLNKIDRLLEQNKTIAKGLSLMEEQIRGKTYEEPEKPINTEEYAPSEMEGYTPSITSSRPLPKF